MTCKKGGLCILFKSLNLFLKSLRFLEKQSEKFTKACFNKNRPYWRGKFLTETNTFLVDWLIDRTLHFHKATALFDDSLCVDRFPGGRLACLHDDKAAILSVSPITFNYRPTCPVSGPQVMLLHMISTTEHSDLNTWEL